MEKSSQFHRIVSNCFDFKDNPNKRPATWVTSIMNGTALDSTVMVGDSCGYVTHIDCSSPAGNLVSTKKVCYFHSIVQKYIQINAMGCYNVVISL